MKLLLVSMLLPPFCFILMAAIGLAIWNWRPRLARNLIAAALALLWIASTTAFETPFTEALQWPAPLDINDAKDAQAIVVLAGGLARHAPEYDGKDTLNSRTLDRVRYSVRLVKQTGLPILVSGGRPDERSLPEAEIMRDVLENEFVTPVRWVETESASTFENARKSAPILREAGIGKVLLVTDASHMRRALQAFAPTGIEIVPAPVNLINKDPLTWKSYLPSPVGFTNSYYVAHELIGRAWYAIRERVE